MPTQNLNEIKIKKKSFISDIIVPLITTLGSIIGSIAVAFIIGRYTVAASIESANRLYNASIDSVSRQIETQNKISQENILANSELSERSNKNQLETTIKTIENTLKVIETENRLKREALIELEKRKFDAETRVALNYFHTDILLRTSFICGVYEQLDNFYKKALRDDPNDNTLLSFSKMKIKIKCLLAESSSWETNNIMFDKIEPLSEEMQRNIMLFYTLIERYHFLSKRIESDKEVEEWPLTILTDSNSSTEHKKLASALLQTNNLFTYNTLEMLTTTILDAGYSTICLLDKELGISDINIKKQQKKYSNFKQTQYPMEGFIDKYLDDAYSLGLELEKQKKDQRYQQK